MKYHSQKNPNNALKAKFQELSQADEHILLANYFQEDNSDGKNIQAQNEHSLPLLRAKPEPNMRHKLAKEAQENYNKPHPVT